MRRNTSAIKIDEKILIKIYEEYIGKKKGEKGEYLENKAKELGITKNRLLRLLRSRFGNIRKRIRNPYFYSLDDILYAIHKMRKEKINLLFVCHKLVSEKNVARKNYHPVKDPVKSFYFAVRRFLKNANSKLEKTGKISKGVMKKAIILSNLSDKEKLVLFMAVEGEYKFSELKGDLKEAARKLISKGFIIRRKGIITTTPALKTYLLPIIENLLKG
ncbi:MAG: hypothetical protein ABIL16_01595 [candidate division WOR-3 bacterium]